MFVSLVSLLFLFGCSLAHIRLVYPTPRSTQSGLKQWPCGGYEFWENNAQSTVIQPGVLTIQWEETINHIGAPFRISISVGSDDNFDCIILADHIPHNDEWSGYSQNNPKPYSFNVTIPDIKCDKCALQIFNAMTDKNPQGTCCPYPNDDGSIAKCNSVYHSCANIQITGSQDSTNFKYNSGPTGAYTQESGNWTFVGNSWWLTAMNFNASRCERVPNGQNCSKSSPEGKKKPVGAIVAVVLLLIIGGALIAGVVYVKKTGKPEKIYHLLNKLSGSSSSKYNEVRRGFRGRDYFPDEDDQEM